MYDEYYGVPFPYNRGFPLVQPFFLKILFLVLFMPFPENINIYRERGEYDHQGDTTGPKKQERDKNAETETDQELDRDRTVHTEHLRCFLQCLVYPMVLHRLCNVECFLRNGYHHSGTKKDQCPFSQVKTEIVPAPIGNHHSYAQ